MVTIGNLNIQNIMKNIKEIIRGNENTSLEFTGRTGSSELQYNAGGFNFTAPITVNGEVVSGSAMFTYVAYATDDAGTDFSVTPTDLLKYRSEIQSAVELTPPTASDFASATWVKYIGDPGVDGLDGVGVPVDTELTVGSDNAARSGAVPPFVQDAVIELFAKPDGGDDPNYDFNDEAFSTTRLEVYSAFRSLELYGFDNTKPHRISRFYLNQSSGGASRIYVESFDGSSWELELDYYSSSDVIIDNILYVDYTDGLKSIAASVDIKNLPASISGVMEDSVTTSSYYIAYDVFKNESTRFKGIVTDTFATYNEVLFDCFDRNTSDLSTLAQPLSNLNDTRLSLYQAFKRIKLRGFDITRKLKIEHFWKGSVDNTKMFRLILGEYNGSSWVRVFDSGNKTYTELGVAENSIFNWVQTVGTYTIDMDIDFANVVEGDQTALNSGDPDLLISKSCMVDTAKLATSASSDKKYFNSRRQPTFAFIWDDLLSSDENVFDIFKEYGFLPSFALKTSNLTDVNGRLYQYLYSQGCSILAHSITHPAMSDAGAITYNEVDDEMKLSKEAIEALTIKVSGWVTPSSTLDNNFFPLMEKNFGYGFTNLNAGLYDETVDPLKMTRYGLEAGIDNDTHSWADTELFIDNAISNNELVVFYGHQLPSWYDDIHGDPLINETDLRALLAYLKTKSDDNLCQVLSCDEAIYQYYMAPLY